MTKAVAIIPARWSSTRFPGKALHSIAGRPLLRHVWERCRRAKKLDRLIIATDDFRIAEAAFDWGAEVAMTSANHASGTDRIAEVAAKLKQFAHVVNVQGDEPLIDPKLIDRLVRDLQRDRNLGMITAAHPFEDSRDAQSPHQVKVVLNQAATLSIFRGRQFPSFATHPRSRNISATRAFTATGATCSCVSFAGKLRRWRRRKRSSNCARWRME